MQLFEKYRKHNLNSIIFNLYKSLRNYDENRSKVKFIFNIRGPQMTFA